MTISRDTSAAAKLGRSKKRSRRSTQTRDVRGGDVGLPTGRLADQAVTKDKLANEAVDSTKIAPGGVTDGDLADGAVTTAKIRAGAISSSSLASGAVTKDKIGPGTLPVQKVVKSGPFPMDTADAVVASIDLAGFGQGYSWHVTAAVKPSGGTDPSCRISDQAGNDLGAGLTPAVGVGEPVTVTAGKSADTVASGVQLRCSEPMFNGGDNLTLAVTAVPE